MEEKKKIKINLKTAVIIIFFIVALICTVFLVSSFSLKTTTENNLVNVFRDTYQKQLLIIKIIKKDEKGLLFHMKW